MYEILCQMNAIIEGMARFSSFTLDVCNLR